MVAKIIPMSHTLIYIEYIYFQAHKKEIVIHVSNGFTIRPLERKTDIARH